MVGLLNRHQNIALGVPERDLQRFATLNELAIEMTLRDQFLRVSGSSTTSTTITLPSVAEAAGLTFTITANIADTAVYLLQDRDDSLNWTNLTLDADEDRVTLYSNGREWVVVENVIA